MEPLNSPTPPQSGNDWLIQKQKQITKSELFQSSNINEGRAPWYNLSNSSKQCLLIGVGGGTASGKTSVCREILKQLALPWVQILSLDSFYREPTKEERKEIEKGSYNFDHPNAFDWQLLESVLSDLKNGYSVRIPQYDFTTHSRKKEMKIIYGCDVCLCEGILILYNKKIAQSFDLKVFVNCDADIRLIRRIKRDMKERGRTLHSILEQYESTVKPSFELFCQPTQAMADIIIPRGKSNVVAIGLLASHINSILIQRGVAFQNKTKIHLMENGKNNNNNNDIQGENDDYINNNENENDCNNVEHNNHNHNHNHNHINNSSKVLPKNIIQPCMKSELIKNAITNLRDPHLNGKQLLNVVNILCKELLTVCMKEVISDLNSTKICQDIITKDDNDSNNINHINVVDCNITNNNNNNINDNNITNDDSKQPQPQQQQTTNNHICIVTLFAGGIIFDETLKSMFDAKNNNNGVDINSNNNDNHNDIDINSITNINNNNVIEYGSIHIFHEQNDPKQPRFLERKLPNNIEEFNKVIIVDSFIGTANRARMALQVLLDHRIKPQNICFISLLSSKHGIASLAHIFPFIKFLTFFDGGSNLDLKHWEQLPSSQSLILRYCKAVGIDINEDDDSEQF